jgi:uncharacterized membrane protein YdfJ with MMPL/SSD domain
MIHSYEVDVVNNRITVKLWVFAEPNVRETQKVAVQTAKELEASMIATAEEARKDQEEFNALPVDKQKVERTDFETRMRKRSRDNQELAAQLQSSQDLANENTAKAEVVLEITTVDTNSFTMADLYEAVKPLLPNSEDSQ